MNENFLISKSASLIEALKLMDTVDKKVLIICDEKKFIGLISIGDIQRAILNKVDLSENILKYIRQDVKYANVDENLDEIKRQMKNDRIECMPIVNKHNELVNIIEWKDLNTNFDKASINLPVVVMAGGEGKRLRPLTNIIPKPLIPVSDKTIIEEIMDRFVAVDCHKFYISVNYMAEVIKDYFAKINNNEYSIDFFREDRPLGTAGSLFLLKDILKKTFFVTNCDVVIDVNFKDLIDYHKNNDNIATLVSVIKSEEIPYGTIDTADNGTLVNIKEKPIFTYQINAGMYVLEPEIFNYIQDNEFLHITTLLSKLKNANKKIGVFPISEKSYSDMGNWDMYMKFIKK